MYIKSTIALLSSLLCIALLLACECFLVFSSTYITHGRKQVTLLRLVVLRLFQGWYLHDLKHAQGLGNVCTRKENSTAQEDIPQRPISNPGLAVPYPLVPAVAVHSSSYTGTLVGKLCYDVTALASQAHRKQLSEARLGHYEHLFISIGPIGDLRVQEYSTCTPYNKLF